MRALRGGGCMESPEVAAKDETREFVKALLAEVPAPVLARRLRAARSTLDNWLAGKSDPRFEEKVREHLRQRTEQWSAIESGDAAARALAKEDLSRRTAEAIEALAELAGYGEDAATLGAEIRTLLAESDRLDDLMRKGGASCWRCGADLSPAPPEVEAQIGANIRGAGWQGWPEDLFICKMRGALRPGDSIIGIRAGAIVVRRADGRVHEVSRWES
jgi:hypothetical protein